MSIDILYTAVRVIPIHNFMLENFGESPEEAESIHADETIGEICYSFSLSISRLLKDEDGRVIGDENTELVINFDKGGYAFMKRVRDVMGFDDVEEAFFRFMDYTMSANANSMLAVLSDEEKLQHMYEHLILGNTEDEPSDYIPEEESEFNDGISISEDGISFTVPEFNFDDEEGLTL